MNLRLFLLLTKLRPPMTFISLLPPFIDRFKAIIHMAIAAVTPFLSQTLFVSPQPHVPENCTRFDNLLIINIT